MDYFKSVVMELKLDKFEWRDIFKIGCIFGSFGQSGVHNKERMQ